MNKVSLGPSIVLYKDININIYDLLKSIDEEDWANEYVINVDGNRSLNLNNRNTKSINVPIKINKDCPAYISDLSSIINEKISKVEEDYLLSNSTKLKSHDDYKILKYDVGGRFNEHRDDGGGKFRRVSWVYYVNDDYEGGHLCFPTFNLDIKPNAGEIIFFPSSFAYPHYVTPVTQGTRYAIASWLR